MVVAESKDRKKPLTAATIGRKIKLMRVLRDVRQQELAAAVGLTVPHLSKLEAGRHQPHRKTLERIAEFFNTTVDWFEKK